MSKKRDTKKYLLKDGAKTVYVGSTNDIKRRLSEHITQGKKFNNHEIVGESVTEESARQWEQKILENYRKNHKGKNPKYNKRDSG